TYCEPTGRANARPMTGSAQQSMAKEVDCVVACAPGNDGRYLPAPLPAPRCPRRRSIVISARIDIAISSGVIAPMSRPAGGFVWVVAGAVLPSALQFSP